MRGKKFVPVVDGMDPEKKRAKTDDGSGGPPKGSGDSGGDGGGGGGNGGGGGGGGGGDDGSGSESSGGGGGDSRRPPSLRTGGAPNPPSDLVLVGKILDDEPNNSPEFQAASGGKMIKADVETWMTDLYRSSHWWIELPNVEDVADVNRGRVKVKAVPLGAPTTSSIVGLANGSQGRIKLEGMKLTLFGGDERNDGWDILSGTPPAWFAQLWNEPRMRTEMEERGRRLAREFKNAKIYVSRSQVLDVQRDWLVV